MSARSQEKVNQLHKAIQDGSIGMVRRLLNAGVSPNATFKGNSPLKGCLGHKDLRIARLLIAAGAQVRDKPKRGKSLLHTALTSGNKPLFYLLINSGADVMETDIEGKTLLHVASAMANDDLAFMRRLLEKGASVNAVCQQGETPLHAPIRSLRTAKVNLLLKYNPDVNLQEHKNLIPSIITRKRYASNEIVEILLIHGFYLPNDPNIWYKSITYGNDSLLERLLETGVDHNLKGILIKHAIKNNNFTAFMALICHGPPHFNRNSTIDGMTAIQHALLSGSELTNNFIANLWNLGADINYSAGLGHSPLHIACSYGMVVPSVMISRFGGDFNLLNRDGYTSLEMIHEEDEEDMFEMLTKDAFMLHSAGVSMSGGNTLLMTMDSYGFRPRDEAGIKSQVEHMKKTLIPNTDIPILSLLHKTTKEISKLKDIQKLANAQHFNDVLKNFELFSPFLHINIQKGAERRQFVDRFITNVVSDNSFLSRLPLVCLDYVISFLCTEDLGIASGFLTPREQIQSESQY